MSKKIRKVNDNLYIKIKDHSDGKGATVDFYDKNPKGSSRNNKKHKSVHLEIKGNPKTGKKDFKVVDTVKGKTESGKGSCYLTSACMAHYLKEFDDNCYELTVLRWFRDNFVTEEDLNHYYLISPAIVEGINSLGEAATNVYEYIYNNVIAPCVSAIERDDFEFAYKKYKNSILIFEEEFVKTNVSEYVK